MDATAKTVSPPTPAAIHRNRRGPRIGPRRPRLSSSRAPARQRVGAGRRQDRRDLRRHAGARPRSAPRPRSRARASPCTPCRRRARSRAPCGSLRIVPSRPRAPRRSPTYRRRRSGHERHPQQPSRASFDVERRCITPDGKLVLNAATAEELTKLPHVGAKRAQAIVLLRQKPRTPPPTDGSLPSARHRKKDAPPDAAALRPRRANTEAGQVPAHP